MSFENLAIVNYRSSLVQELKLRMERNPSYSLRAFARDIDVSPGYLSQLINQQKSLSPRKAVSILKHLRWSYDKEKKFLSSVQYEHSETVLDEEPFGTPANGPEFSNMTLDIFELISRWHYGAILELLSLPNCTPKTEWISDKLDLPLSTADEAIKRLLRMGFLKQTKTGFQRCDPHLQIENMPSEAIRNFHRESLDRARVAIDLQEPNTRFFSSVILPFKSDRIKIVGDQIEKFRDSVNRQESKDPGNSVYQLCVSFFRVDANTKDS